MSTKEIIEKTLVVLNKIHRGEKVFFNIQQYKSLGLVISRDNWGKDCRGNKTRISTSYFLTNKAKQFIRVPIYAVNHALSK